MAAETVAEDAFPAVFDSLFERFRTGGVSRTAHAAVRVPWAFLAHLNPINNHHATISHEYECSHFDAWVVCAGRLLPFRVLASRHMIANADVVTRRARAINEAELPAMPDILGCTFRDARADDVPARLRPRVQHLTAGRPMVGLAFYLMEHSAPVDVDIENGCSSTEALDRLSARLYATAMRGAPVNVATDLRFTSLGVTHQRHKVLRFPMIREPAPSRSFVQEQADEMTIMYHALLRASRLSQQQQQQLRQQQQQKSTAQRPGGSGGRGNLWIETDDAAVDEDAVAEFRLFRQSSLVRLRGRGHIHADDGNDGAPTPPARSTPPPEESSEEPALGTMPTGLSTMTVGEDAQEDFVPQFTAASDCTVRTSTMCDNCSTIVFSSGYNAAVVQCGAGDDPHVVCATCVNRTIVALISLDFVKDIEAASLTCCVAGCTGKWYFDDYAALLLPSVRRAWCRRSIELIREETTREVQERIDDAFHRRSGAEGSNSGGGGDGNASGNNGDATASGNRSRGSSGRTGPTNEPRPVTPPHRRAATTQQQRFALL